jgi:hypothetical protein
MPARKKTEKKKAGGGFSPKTAKHCKNVNLYSAIVAAGGEKRVAVIAANKHRDMDPNKNKAYVASKATQAFDIEKSRKPPGPKRVTKTSPTTLKARRAKKVGK